MKNDQYQFPLMHQDIPVESQALQAESLSEALRIADTFSYTPESQPEAFQYIKNIETRIHTYRETAIAVETRKTQWRRALRSYVLAPKSPAEKIVDKEAIVGGRLFKKAPDIVSQRFWYHDEHRGRGDWFFESVDIQKRRTVIQFQTTSSSIEKLVNGVPCTLDGNEAEVISILPKLYERAVLKSLYPIDDALQDTDDSDREVAAA